VLLATVVGALGMAGPASAHVTVNPDEATQGQRARVNFRVPNESDTESTTGLEVHFPQETPISSVSVGTMPGWRAEVTYRTLDTPIEGGHGEQITEVVEVITWTAESEDAAIQPGEFAEFAVSLGPLPEADQLVFPTLQTYSDGEIVRWIDEPEAGGEPEFPAPVITLAAAGTGNGDGATAAGAEGEGTPGAEEPAASEPESDADFGAGGWLGVAGLVAGLAGLALGGIAFARTRQG
jgi:uncharacterized protein YcnI